jgi:uncharacterized membrane protein YphA (DoxX/SURF4 family)
MIGIRPRTEVGVVAARIVLGAVFIVASIEKVADPAAFAVSINNYKILPEAVSLVVATFLPWVELLCGFGLLFGIFMRGSSLLSLCMLAVFTAAIVSGLFRGLDISCGCFTQDPNVAKIGWGKVAENVGLIILSALPLVSRSSLWSIENLFRTRNSPQP